MSSAEAVELEHEVNEQVYNLFGLAKEEIELVEQAIRRTDADANPT